MIRKFLEEVDAIEANLRSGALAGQAAEYVTDPVADGETQIGIVSDPWLKALFLAYKARADATPQKLADIYALGAAKVAELNNEFGPLQQLIGAELRIALGIFTENIEFRAGWVVVKTEPKTRRMRVTFERIDFGNFIDRMMNDVMSAGCGDPNCRSCGGGHTPAS